MDPKYKNKLGEVLKTRQAEIATAFATGDYAAARIASAKLSYWIAAVEDYDITVRGANNDLSVILA